MATTLMPSKQDHSDLLWGSPSQGSCHPFSPHWRQSYQPWSLNRHSKQTIAQVMTHWVHCWYILYYLLLDNQKMFLVHQPWFLMSEKSCVCIYMKVTEFDSFIANTPIPFLRWEWHSRKAWTLLGRCPGKPQKIDLNVMTVPIRLSLQTIDRSEAVRLNLYLRWRNFTEQEVSCPQFAQAPRESFLHLFLFFF